MRVKIQAKRPHPGKVNSQAKRIFFIIASLEVVGMECVLTPKIAEILVWVVDTGRPIAEAANRQKPPARSADSPWRGPRPVIPWERELMIRCPPQATPAAIVAAHIRAREGGTEKV